MDSPYLQVIFVRENIAIKRPARLPESSIQTGSLTELQMQTIVSFHWQTSSTGTSINYFYFFVKRITFKFFFIYQVHKEPRNNPHSWRWYCMVWHELLTRTQWKYVLTLISNFRLSNNNMCVLVIFIILYTTWSCVSHLNNPNLPPVT